ncbi:MAG: hypothetical protein NWQ53_11265 [Flavobacteriales bacterium]|nr:hypothetical protein [Flavobacteriales bacterium]
MKAAFGFLLLSCLFFSCAQEVEQKSLAQDVPSHDDHFSAAAVVSKEVRWAKGFAFYEDSNETGVKLFAKENNWELEIARVARLKTQGIPRDGVIYLDDEGTFAAQSTTQMALFESIQALEHLSCVAYLDYVKSEAIHAAVERGEMMDISGAKEIDFEKLVMCAPDAVLVYPFGYDNEAQFQAAGVPTIPISEYLEAQKVASINPAFSPGVTAAEHGLPRATIPSWPSSFAMREEAICLAIIPVRTTFNCPLKPSS